MAHKSSALHRSSAHAPPAHVNVRALDHELQRPVTTAPSAALFDNVNVHFGRGAELGALRRSLPHRERRRIPFWHVQCRLSSSGRSLAA